MLSRSSLYAGVVTRSAGTGVSVETSRAGPPLEGPNAGALAPGVAGVIPDGARSSSR